jgi:hypothetical protein
MIRTFICLIATACFALLPAVDTSLILTKPAGEGDDGRFVIIDPGSGYMRLYESKRGGRGADALQQRDVANFRIHLDQIQALRFQVDNPLAKLDRGAEKKVVWPLLRMGSLTTIPQYGAMFNYFVNEKQRIQVIKSDDAFYAVDPIYDGTVRAALSKNYLLVVVPSHYVMLMYKIIDDEFELVSFRNYRPELYLALPDQPVKPAIDSLPDFNALKAGIRRLGGGATVLAERARQFEQELEAMETEEELIPIAKSDPWVKGLIRDRFVVVDPATKRMMVYEVPRADTLGLKSLRNLDLDFRIPSWPLPNRDLSEFDGFVVDQYMARLKRLREDAPVEAMLKDLEAWAKEARSAGELKHFNADRQALTIALFRSMASANDAALVGEGAVKSDNEPYDVVTDNQERLVLDLKQERRLLIYFTAGNNNRIELVSARDYTIDTGVGTYDYLVKRKQDAVKILKTRIMKEIRRRDLADLNMTNIAYVLTLAPELVDEIEKERRITTTLSDHPDWQPTIEKAIAAKEAKMQAFQGLIQSTREEILSKEAALAAAKERAGR